MKNVFHRKKWNMGTVQVHVVTIPTTPIKGKNGEKSDNDLLK